MKDKSTLFLAVWHMEGLESLINLDKEKEKQLQWEHERTICILTEKPVPERPQMVNLTSLLLRARYNSQRNYEIYSFRSNVLEEDILEMFDEQPQLIVDWLRKNGKKIYSDYVPSKKKIIV